MSPILDFDHALAGNLRAARLESQMAADEGLARAAACRQEIGCTWELFGGLSVAAVCAAKRSGDCCFPEVALNHIPIPRAALSWPTCSWAWS